MKGKNTKIILGVVIAVALIIGGIVGVNLYKNSKNNSAAGSGEVVQGQQENGKQFTVTFANTSDTTEDMEKATKLPGTVSVEPGTLISTLETPERFGSMFRGWYYDADKLLAVGDLDRVNDDLTLYPKFTTKEGYHDEFSPNFVSSRNMGDGFAVKIAAYGLEQAAVLELLHGWNMSQGKTPVAIDLVPIDEKLVAQEGMMYLVDENGDIVEQVEDNGNDGEGINMENPLSELDDATRKELESVGVDLDTATEAELREYYGLEKDESVIRFLREKMDLDIESAILLQSALDRNAELKNGKYYIVIPQTGEWTPGELFQIELTDTSRVRFVYNDALTGSKVSLYNFSIERQEVNTLVIREGVTYIPVKDTAGVEVGGGLFNLTASADQGIVDKNVSAGIMTYSGALAKGNIIAVYDGTLKEDGTVDGQVSYLEVTEVLGDNRYSYTGAELEKVLFIPDVLPVLDDGSYEDGKVVVKKSQLSFEAAEYRKLHLDKDTTVDKGDFITFYTGNLNQEQNIDLVGYGKITAVTDRGDSYEIYYNSVDVNQVLSSFQMYSTVDDVEIPVTQEVENNLRSDMVTNISQSNLAEESAKYIAGLITGDLSDLSKYENADELKRMTFQTDDGKELTLEEVRLLADGGAKRVKVSDPTLQLTLDHKLQHFSGEGIRGEVSVNFTVEIELNSVGSVTNKIEISVTVALQQEIVLGLDVSVGSEWKWYACFPVLDEVTVDAAVRAGTYSGFGVVATIQTKSDNASEDSEWGDLIKATGEGQLKEVVGLEKMGTKLEELSKTLDKVQKGGGYSTSDSETKTGAGMTGSGIAIGGDLPSKYSGMLSNDAEYINLVKQELFRLPISPDPLHLIEFSLEADLVVSFKLNCMIGAGISYGNAKQYSFHAKVFAKESSTSEADLETPNFRADFYVFGMVGARVGILLDARVGIISTKMDSIGITAEAGFYAELYGFLYVFYAWESGNGVTSGAMGSMLFEIGMYVDVNFVAQLGEGKLSGGKEIYSNTWPLLQLGAEAVPMDFEIKQNDEKLSVEIPEHKNTVKVPDELFNMKMMSLKDGSLSTVSKDSAQQGEAGYSFTVNGRSFTQYNEQFFEIVCHDTDKDGNIISGNSFQYLPATNEIYVKPANSLTDELWGVVEFTFRDETFGFNTVQLSKKVKVHWKGVPASATVQYYLQKDDGTYEFYEEGQFDGFDGIEYDLVVTEDLVYKYVGYRLASAKFMDEDRMDARLAELKSASDAARRDYEQHPSNKYYQAYEKASKQYSAAWKHKIEYWDNIRNALNTKTGTLYFLMSSNDTVVKLYYQPRSYEVNYYVDPEFIKLEGSNSYAMRHKPGKTAKTYLPIRSSLFGGMPEGIQQVIEEDPLYEYNYYLYTYHQNIDNHTNQTRPWAEISENRDKWVKLSDDAILPDENACIFYVIAMPEIPKEFTATFRSDTQVISTIETAYKSEIAFPEDPTKDGCKFVGWRNDKTGKMVESGQKMDGEDMNFTAVWEANKYLIHCIVEDRSWTVEGTFGENLLDTINEDENTRVNARFHEGYGVEWHARGEGNDVIISLIYTVPDTDITVYGEYVVDPEHRHVWNVGTVIKEATCSAEGETEVFCSVCGKKEIQIVPKNENHVGFAEQGAVKVTCLTDGKKPNIVCTGCGYVKSYGEIIRARGAHTFRQGVVTDYSTCSTHGHVLWTCDVCGEEKIEESSLDSFRHSGPFVNAGNSKAVTCGQDGFTGDTICSGCGQLSMGGMVISATGKHTYENLEYKWAADYSTCTGTAVCSVCGDKLEETDTTALIGSLAADCEIDGYEEYRAPFGYVFVTQDIIKILPAIGHDYTITYTWSEGYSECTASAVCKHNSEHVIRETVVAMQNAVRYEDGSGKTDFTATFKNTIFKTQTKQTLQEACRHQHLGTITYTWNADHSSVVAKVQCTDCNKLFTETAKSTKSVKKAATCEADGQLLYSASFTNTIFATQTYTETLAKLGHRYNAPVYTWTEDKSGCTAEMICANDATHKITETVSTTREDSTQNGKLVFTYTAQFANTAFTTQQKAVIHEESENTPTVSYQWNDTHSQVTATATYPISGEPLIETVSTTVQETAATCETDGQRVYTATFVHTVFSNQTYTESIPHTGHSYGTVTYTWASDYATCTAEMICAKDSGHKVTETVSATVTSTVNKGVDLNDVTYQTQAFTNTSFAAQSKTVEVDSCAHVWSDGVEDFGNVTFRESATGTYVSADGTKRYEIASEAWESHTCTKCNRVIKQKKLGFVDLPPEITLEALNNAGYHTIGDVINADPSVFGQLFRSIGEYPIEGGGTANIVVNGTHEVTGFRYFDNEKVEFITKEEFIALYGGESAPLKKEMGLNFVVLFHPTDLNYYQDLGLTAEMEIQ